MNVFDHLIALDIYEIEQFTPRKSNLAIRCCFIRYVYVYAISQTAGNVFECR